MKFTDRTREILACRREDRDMTRDGWERVDESGGMLWQITRGSRWTQRIVDVRIARSGYFLWVKIADSQTARPSV